MRLAYVLIASWLWAIPASGQQRTECLPVAGAMIYNRVSHGAHLGVSYRFAGRFMVRMSSKAYLGLFLADIVGLVSS